MCWWSTAPPQNGHGAARIRRSCQVRQPSRPGRSCTWQMGRCISLAGKLAPATVPEWCGACSPAAPAIADPAVGYCSIAASLSLRCQRIQRNDASASADDAGATLNADPAALRSTRANRRGYWLFFFSCLAARFSFRVLLGFFFSFFFESIPLLMSFSAMWMLVIRARLWIARVRRYRRCV